MEERHAAIIKVSKKRFLKGLDFEGGIIHRVYEPEVYFEPDHFCVVLEHPDLPKVNQGDLLYTIQPIYQFSYGEDGSLIKIERIEPKGEKEYC